MTGGRNCIPIEYDPRLVEQAVELSIRGNASEREFHRRRESLYLLPDGESRELEFQRFHSSWFLHLELGRALAEVLAELPVLAARSRRCCVFPALSASEEGADLHQQRATQGGGSRDAGTVVVRMTAPRFLEQLESCLWLRRELMHVADILDPAFRYSPEWPASRPDPAAINLHRERYGVLWDTWIDGRLFRQGSLPPGMRELRLAEFTAAFGAFSQDSVRHFEEVFGAETWTQAALLEMALNPDTGAGKDPSAPSIALPCPLCRFLTFELRQDAAGHGADVIGMIQSDFPAWQPEHGLCRQCADLYVAREMSRAAAAVLPGIR